MKKLLQLLIKLRKKELHKILRISMRKLKKITMKMITTKHPLNPVQAALNDRLTITFSMLQAMCLIVLVSVGILCN